MSNSGYRFPAVALALLMLAAFVAAAYELPLSPESVREAYFLGRHGQHARDFLDRYSKILPASQSSELEFSRVQILTPYAQIVSAALQDMLNDTAVDADQYYQGRSLPVLIKLWVYCPSASGYSSVPFDRCSDSIRRTSIAVSQFRGIHAQDTTYTTLYTATKDAKWPDGVEVELQFSASQFQSAPVQISIATPDGQHAEATFDLAALK
ncbi:MAG: hypothetical protein ACRD5K_05735 [Candidatus Acidiferrales bacterium]